jgi:hypothetical protein
MKNKLLLLPLFLLLVLISCKKDDNNQVTYTSGTPPVLTSSYTSSNALFLDPTTPNAPALTFSWTNPNYKFSNGISSQDVSYTLQVDTTGSNFTNPNMQEISISKDLSKSFTVKELNTVLNKMSLVENMTHNISFRLKSSINGAVPLYSNVITTKVTPYLDVAVPLPPTKELYITGDATHDGWTNTPSISQKMTPVASTITASGPTSFTITLPLSPGFQYKFLSTQGQWQPQYGGTSATGGDLGYNMGNGTDPSAIPTPSSAGTYKITVNFRTGQYTVEKQ